MYPIYDLLLELARINTLARRPEITRPAFLARPQSTEKRINSTGTVIKVPSSRVSRPFDAVSA